MLLCQSLPRVVRWINAQVSERWDRVSISGLHECVDRTDSKRNGGWHKGRWRIRTVPLERSCQAFEATRAGYRNAAVVAGKPSKRLVRPPPYRVA